MPKNKTKSLTKKQKAYQLLWEFVKLQLAGNIPFWGTYIINLVLDKGFSIDKFQALLVATVLANAVFFIVDDRWVFSQTRPKRKTTDEIVRFVIFMSLSALLVFNITWQLYTLLGISTYIGQFISAALSILWTFIGLRFWVFAPAGRRKLKVKRA
jgi:putative flippase GtrA